MWSQLVDALASLGPVASIAVVSGFVLLVVAAVWLVTSHMKGDEGKGRYARLRIANGRVLDLEINAKEHATETPANRPQLLAARKPALRKGQKRRRGGRGRQKA